MDKAKNADLSNDHPRESDGLSSIGEDVREPTTTGEHNQGAKSPDKRGQDNPERSPHYSGHAPMVSRFLRGPSPGQGPS